MDNKPPRTLHNKRGKSGNGPPALPNLSEKKFAKTASMRTAKAMVDTNRQETQRAEAEEHLGPPPAGANLIQARLVLPGKHLLPSRLDDPEALHDIRRQYKVYITNVKPNILDIQCDSISRLQEAIKAINWTIHEMRLSDDHPAISFLLQEPTNAFEGGIIKAELASRPYFISKAGNGLDNTSALDKHVSKMTTELLDAVPTLTTLNKNLSMRVIFGHLTLKLKKKGSGNELSKEDFVKLLDVYSSRGGASLDPKLLDVNEAVNLLQHLTNPSTGVCESIDAVTYNCSLVFSMQGKEIATDIMTDTGHGKPLLALPRATKSESWARLNWTFAAPDMKHDWTFRVDTLERSAEFPSAFNSLDKKIILEYRKDENEEDGTGATLLQFPRINKLQLGVEQNEVTKICMRRTATIPYKDTPYMLEFNVTKTWEGNRVSSPPEVTWGIELFGAHWEESLNHIGRDQRKKDWGAGLENIWHGSEDLDTRFGQFLKSVLEVQALLEGSGPHEGSLLD